MRIIKFYRLPIKEKFFFVINFCMLGLVRILTLSFNYRKISFMYGHFCKMHACSFVLTEEEKQSAKKLSSRLRLASKNTPWRSNCLTMSIAARLWCAYYKLPFMFYIGFPKSSRAPLGIEAHAWVMSGSIDLTGGNGFETHAVVQSYSSETVQQQIELKDN